MRDGKVQSRFTARRQEFARNTVLPHRGMSSAMSHGRLVLFVSLALVAGTTLAGPPGGRRDRQDEPRIVVAHEARPNERSLADDVRRVKRDPKDPAKLLLEPVDGQQGPGYLPVLAPGDPMNPQWAGQEAAGFPDNWTIGLSFLHNLFVREHNSFVNEFRRIAAATPNADCGLRNPADPKTTIRYKDIQADELFAAARLVVSAEIAKIHTTEWTPQLLYGEPLYEGMNANWSGLLGTGDPEVSKALAHDKLEAMFDLGYHLKQVDTIFKRVFGA